MAAPPRLKSFTAESFPDAPEWFHKFVSMLSPALSDVAGALSGRLSKENLARQVKVLTVQTQSPVSATWPLYYKNELAGKPYSVVVGGVVAKTAGAAVTGTGVAWTLLNDGRIRIDEISGLATASSTYEVTLVADA